MILLDTNAILWLLTGHPRAGPIRDGRHRLVASPVSLLELQLLIEVGRLELAAGVDLAAHISQRGWRLDSPTSQALFEAAIAVGWTRDPFDRLLVAHAHLRRWRLATGDRMLIAGLPAEDVVAL